MTDNATTATEGRTWPSLEILETWEKVAQRRRMEKFPTRAEAEARAKEIGATSKHVNIVDWGTTFYLFHTPQGEVQP